MDHDIHRRTEQCPAEAGRFLQGLPGLQRCCLPQPHSGPGAKGVGDTAIRNYDKWAEIRLNMDVLCPGGEIDTSCELFGRSFRYPFFAGPVGAVNLHYSDAYHRHDV